MTAAVSESFDNQCSSVQEKERERAEKEAEKERLRAGKEAQRQVRFKTECDKDTDFSYYSHHSFLVAVNASIRQFILGSSKTWGL